MYVYTTAVYGMGVFLTSMNLFWVEFHETNFMSLQLELHAETDLVLSAILTNFRETFSVLSLPFLYR
jgi:hypothetical protein